MKKALIFILITVTILTSTQSTLSFGDSTSDKLLASEYAMFDLYRGARGLQDIDEIDPNEMLVFGIFLSNYIEPFASDEQNKGYNIFTGVKESYLYTGQSSYREDNIELIEKVIERANKNALLKLIKEDGYGITFQELVEKESLVLYISGESGDKFKFYDSSNDLSLAGLLLAMAKGSDYISGNYEQLKTSTIGVDGFGNMIFMDGILKNSIIIPACLNPYLFSESGDKLFFVNDYYLANYNLDLGNHYNPIAYTMNYWSKSGSFISDSLKSAGYTGTILLDNRNGMGNYSDGMRYNYGIEAKETRVVNEPNVVPKPISVLGKKNEFASVALIQDYDEYYNNIASSIKSYNEDVVLYYDDLEDMLNKQVTKYKLFINFREYNSLFRDSKGGLFAWFDTDFGKALKAKVARLADLKTSFGIETSAILSNIAEFNYSTGKATAYNLLKSGEDGTRFVLSAYKQLAKGVEDTTSNHIANSKFFHLVIVPNYLYKCLTLNDIKLISTFTSETTQKQIKTTADNLVVHMFYTYLQYYAGGYNVDGFKGIEGYNSEIIALLVEANDYIDLAAEFKAKKATNNDNLTAEQLKQSLMKRITGLLDPDDGSIRVSMLSSTINSFVQREHYKRTNASGKNGASGLLQESEYGVTSFLTTPYISELNIFNKILDNYGFYYIIAVLLITILMILILAVGFTTVKRTIFLYIFALIILVLPPVILNNTSYLSNKIPETIFTDKFQIWALTQHQEYLYESASDSSSSLLADDIQMIKNTKSDTGVLLKWNTPKKVDQFNSLYNMSFTGQKTVGLKIFKWVSSGMLNQEFFPTNDEYYVYRSYYGITQTAKDAYDNAKNRTNLFKTYTSAIDYSYTNKDEATKYASFTYKPLIRTGNTPVYAPNFSNGNAYLRHMEGFLIENINSNDSKFTIQSIAGNVQMESTEFDVANIISKNNAGLTSVIDLNKLYDDVSKTRNPNEGFLNQTEGVYFYFYNVLRDYYKDVNTQVEGTDLINTGFSGDLFKDDLFKVTDRSSPAYNEIKDFLDMENLFTNVIPQLRVLNNIAIQGIDMIENTFSLNPDLERNPALKADMQKQFWAIFSPWVSALYRTEYWKNNNIGIQGGRAEIYDAFNPSCYEEYRPMVFSKAQQIALGLGNMPLSAVEQKIQRVLELTYRDCLYAINHISFSDEVLISHIALRATFHFNREFSQSFAFKENVELHPQSYNLRGFSYDVFLKMYLSTSTGAPLMGNEDFYTKVIDGSIFSGILLLLVDILCVNIIPTFKTVFIIVLFLGVYLSILKVLFSLQASYKELFIKFYKLFLLPVVLYILTSSAYAYIMSKTVASSYNNFIDVENTVVIANTFNSLLLLFAISAIYCILVFVILKNFIVDTIQEIKTMYEGTKSVIKWGINAPFRAVGAVATGIRVSGERARMKEFLESYGRREKNKNADHTDNSQDLDKYETDSTITELKPKLKAEQTKQNETKSNKKTTKEEVFDSYDEDTNENVDIKPKLNVTSKDYKDLSDKDNHKKSSDSKKTPISDDIDMFLKMRKSE